MGHPKELIDRIVALLCGDYPPDCGYQYIVEKRLKAKALDRSIMMPDIAVARDGCTVCVVEIGYTRPEKLTAYRDTLRIPDVRWYGKDGTLHADVQERVVSVSVSAEPVGDLYAYPVFGIIECPHCEEGDPRRVPEECATRYIRRFGEDAYTERQDQAAEAAAEEVFTHVLTDYVAVWLPTECDKCGKAWLADDDEGFFLIDACRDEPRNIAKCLDVRRTRLSWAQARSMVEGYGLTLNYLDGHFLDERHRRDIHVTARQA